MLKKLFISSVLLLQLLFSFLNPAFANAQSRFSSMEAEIDSEGLTGVDRYPTSSDLKFNEEVFRSVDIFDRSEALSTTTLTTTTTPNVIVILTDDQPPDTLGVAGNTIIKTPNIDKLATSGGMYFSNTYVTTPLCAPSRSSLLTSRMAHSHGVLYNNLLLPTNQITLPKVLKLNGFDTAMIGKCHIGDYRELGYDYQVETGPYPLWGNGSYTVLRNGVSETQTLYHTRFLTNEAIKYISDKTAQQATSKKPFFVWLAYNAPHAPNSPPSTPDRYQASQFVKPVSWTDNLSTKPLQQSLQKPHQIISTGKFTWEDLQVREEKLYEEISIVDDSVGRIKQKLLQLGIADNTIIVYLSDNGVMYGEHQIYGKGAYFYEEQVKSPLIINYPKIVQNPGKKLTYVSSIDLAPTILSMLGIPVPSRMQGKSLLPFIKGQSAVHRNSAYFEWFNMNGLQETYLPMRGLVMDKYKLIHHLATGDVKELPDGSKYAPDGKDFEFYNLNSDPNEMVNLAKRNSTTDSPLNRLREDSTYGRQIRKMLREIAVWQVNTKDPMARVITNLRYTWINPTSVKITWNTPDNLTSELVYKRNGCTSCTQQEKYDFTYTKDHSVTVTGIDAQTRYDFIVYSISVQGNGVHQRLTVEPMAHVAGDVTDEGDQPGDEVNTNDINRVKASFGNPYTIFDYNTVVGNLSR